MATNSANQGTNVCFYYHCGTVPTTSNGMLTTGGIVTGTYMTGSSTRTYTDSSILYMAPMLAIYVNAEMAISTVDDSSSPTDAPVTSQTGQTALTGQTIQTVQTSQTGYTSQTGQPATSPKGLQVGVAVGIAIVVLVIVIGLVLLALWLWRRKRRAMKATPTGDTDGAEGQELVWTKAELDGEGQRIRELDAEAKEPPELHGEATKAELNGGDARYELQSPVNRYEMAG